MFAELKSGSFFIISKLFTVHWHFPLLLESNAVLLNFSTIDIWGWTILFRERGCPLNSKIFCSIPSLPSPTLNCNKQMYQKYPNAFGEQKSPPVEKYCSNTTNYCPTSFALVTLALPSPFNLNVTYLGKPFLPTTLGLMLLICLLMVFDNYLSGYLQWF